MLVDEISTKVVKRWAIILMVETVGFLAHMGYNIITVRFFIDDLIHFIMTHITIDCLIFSIDNMGIITKDNHFYVVV